MNNRVTRLSKTFLKQMVLNQSCMSVVAIFILFLFGEIIFPGFISFSHVMSVLRMSVFLGIIALGQTLVVISGNEGIDLSVGSILSLGVVISAFILQGENLRIPIVLIVVPLIGFLLGIVSGAGIAYIGIPPLIMTLAMASVIEGSSLIITKGFPTGNAPPFLEVVGSGRIFEVPYLILLWGVIIVVVSLLLKRTKWGHILYGVGANSFTAELSGINVKRFRMVIYGICGAISAFGGLLLLSYTGTPYLNLGVPYLMPSIAAVAIGGISLAGGSGTYLGAVAGCIVLTTLNSILVALQTTEAMRQIAYGALLFLLIVAYTRRKSE
ncbi:ABC transporter, membrane spanning protein (Ribose) [Candidatus Vecturithrix granuli]|uniref:Autoinducer 2 import system permease protein LsrD n=1 Tax=Vecturithrix granuli TaxID=1499967 RepID=A0A081C0Q7_VECG1|nr:ABC transporter, membrane spanning protein (Ribose) [Candidatus Vecturithrix granuli]